MDVHGVLYAAHFTRRGDVLLQRYAGPVIISRYRLAITGPSANWRFSSRNYTGLSWWPSCSSLAIASNSISRDVMDYLPAGGHLLKSHPTYRHIPLGVSVKDVHIF